MEKQIKTKKNKAGITLVALIVTIIVLLILAGITINLTIGQDGIIRIAQEAGKNYTNSAEYERNELAELTNTTDKIIQNVTGVNIGGSTPTIDASVLALEVGDYIKYDTGVSTVGKNGVITCRVLYPASSQYGLQIISDKNVKKVTLGGSNWDLGKQAYNDAIKDLNNEAEQYINTEYAQDARCVGSIPTVDEKGNMIGKNNGTEKTVTVYGTATGCYDTDANFTIDKAQMEQNGLWTTQESYWIASRKVVSDSSYTYFYICGVSKSGSWYSYNLCDIHYNSVKVGHSYSVGFRPCISLKSYEIKIIGGTGKDAENAYVIGK